MELPQNKTVLHSGHIEFKRSSEENAKVLEYQVNLDMADLLGLDRYSHEGLSEHVYCTVVGKAESIDHKQRWKQLAF